MFSNSTLTLDISFSNEKIKNTFLGVVAETCTIGLREISASLKISCKFGDY